MIISRDRHLDDSSQFHLTLALQTRTPEMHSLFSDAPDDVRDRVGEVLALALDQVHAILRPLADARRGRAETGSFGCGT